jgi:hypothetical protein
VQHVKYTLPKNLAHNRGQSKFILLNYNSQDGLVEYLKENHAVEIETGKLVVYTFPEPTVFHMTHAKNMAHRCGILEGADILCNLDADNFTGENFDEYVARCFDSQENIYLWTKMFTQADGRRPRGISGRIVVSDKAFVKVGGYDEKFNTWHHDDKDFNVRLKRAHYAGVEIPEHFLDVILHNNKMRFKDYPQAASNADSSVPMAEPESIVANYGKIGMGTVFRNFDWNNPIQIGPIPTRIFGIGLHKTGTTSLHSALKMLGFESEHWKSAHWALAIWKEMNSYGKSWTVEHGYALSDLPMAVLYKELDKAYPGSKFILTLRNEGQWLKSVEKHWSHKHNQFRAQWDHDPFSHMIHKVIYGQRGFDADLFLERYVKHNEDVKEYFKDRPHDLLVMDMSNGAGWDDLCKFLNKPVPNVPYPKLLVTQ